MEQEINWFEHFVLGMQGLQKLSMETPCIALLDDGWVSVHRSLYINSPNALRLRASTIGREDATEIDKIDWIAKRSETIVNLTIGDYVVPCKITEKPDFDSDSDEPIELKWRLSCEVDDAGYSVFSQAYYRGTFCSLGVATTRGILEDLEFLKADKDSVISVDFTFRRLAMMRNPRSEWYRQKGQSRSR